MKRLTIAALVVLLALAAVPTGALAQDGTGGHAGHDLTISDAVLRIDNVHVSGTGLPHRSVDHATYTVRDSTATLDGMHVTLDGHHYEIGRLTLRIRNVGVTVSDVSIS